MTVVAFSYCPIESCDSLRYPYGMSATILPFVSPGNNPIAELRRVEELLRSSGLSLISAYGFTDDGAPWVTFSDPETEDVIISIELVDGKAIARSRAFITNAKASSVADALQRMLLDLRARNGSPVAVVYLAVVVAMAVQAISEAEANGELLPFDAVEALSLPVIVNPIVPIVIRLIEAAEALMPAPSVPTDAPDFQPSITIEPLAFSDQPEPSSAVMQIDAPMVVINLVEVEVQTNQPALDRDAEIVMPLSDFTLVATIPQPSPASEVISLEAAHQLVSTIEQSSDAGISYEYAEGLVQVYAAGIVGERVLYFDDGSALALIGVSDMQGLAI